MWMSCCLFISLGTCCWAIALERSLFTRYLEHHVKLIDDHESENAVSDLIKQLNYNMDADQIILDKDITSNETEVILQQYSIGEHNEDRKLNIDQLITKYGYPVEEHKVVTEDGYILTIFRIPGKGSTVFLMHGLLGSSDDFVTAGPESGIAYLLASEGYDVWLGNARGNKHSRNHVHLSADKAEFWDFSWDEIGRFDLPATIDYVLSITNSTKLKYAGHSQGTTSFFVMASVRPEYNEKISLMVALSAVAWLSHARSPIVRLLAPYHKSIHTVLKVIGVNEFQPSNSVVKFIQNTLCGTTILAEVLCSNLAFLICGFNRDQLNVTNLPVIYGHMPSGAAAKQIVHYGQSAVSGQFRKFDYGPEGNIKKYGVEAAPDYPVERISARVVIFAGSEDWLAAPEDVEMLSSKLPNKEIYKVKDKQFNHMDFLWAKDVKTLVYAKMSDLFQKYTIS